MPITKVNNIITETTPVGLDEFNRTGVIRAEAFAICDNFDFIKQMQFDPSALTTNTTLTLTAPSGSGGVVTLPTSGTVATTANLLTEVIQYATPTAGSTVTITAGTQDLVLKPAGTLATLTVVLPTTPADGTTVAISSTQVVTSLTLNAGGSDTVSGALAAFTANGFAKYIYRAADTNWYRIG